MERQNEIRDLLKLSPQQVIEMAGERLVVCDNVNDLHHLMAKDICGEIEANNNAGQPTRLILPVGPTGQYPILSQLINTRQVSLEHCWFFFMDEYCTFDGKAVSIDHPLSFKNAAHTLFLNNVLFNKKQVHFPEEDNIQDLPHMIDEIGGIDTCYGGIGIHGHVAFNEPEDNIADKSARKVRLNDFTVTINAIRSRVGGNIESFPRFAYTLGMKEILRSKRIKLYCRNGCEFDWANTVLRVALFGSVGDDYPVTHIRNTNYTIITDQDTIKSPAHVL